MCQVAPTGEVELIVRDDRVGFDPATRGDAQHGARLGLLDMQERPELVGGL